MNLVVSDIDAAAAWYRDKLGCRTRPKNDEDEGDWDEVESAVVCSLGGVEAIYLIKPTAGSNIAGFGGPVSMIYCSDLKKGMEHLTSRGVSVGPVQEDRDGSKFFDIHDLDGNKLQILQS